jgi:hypothetical protein
LFSLFIIEINKYYLNIQTPEFCVFDVLGFGGAGNPPLNLNPSRLNFAAGSLQNQDTSVDLVRGILPLPLSPSFTYPCFCFPLPRYLSLTLFLGATIHKPLTPNHPHLASERATTIHI